MHILFDLWAIQPVSTRLLQGTPSKFNGGAEYAKAVLFKLLELKKEEKISVFYDPTKEIPSDVENLLKEKEIRLFPVKNKLSLQSLIDKGIFDRFYSALPYNYYDIDFSNVDVIFSLHGLRPLEIPRDKYELKYDKSLKNVLKYLFKVTFREKYLNIRKKQFYDLINVKARRKIIIVPSYHTKYSLLSYFPDLDVSKIEVFYAPAKISIVPSKMDENNFLEKLDVKSEGYFLIVSGDRWIKNSYRAIKALDDIFSYFKLNKKVVVLGIKNKKQFQRYVFNKEKFVFWPYVNERELEILYKNAFLFIYPTLNEGFGYPPLESMKYGTPVICSAISSTTEVCGDAVVYFNPFSIEELINRVLYILFEDKEYARYSKMGKERYDHLVQQQHIAIRKISELILQSR